MTPVDRRTIEAALAGDRIAIRAFVDAMTPIIQARVVRGYARRGAVAKGRDLRQDVADATQDVFATLFAHGGRTLLAWDPERGLSLANFVGLVAERHVASMFRSPRRNPWRDEPEDLDTLEPKTAPVADATAGLESRRDLERLLDRMRASLSPRGLELFERLYVREEPIEEVAPTMGMTREAIYAWRNRVGKLLQKFANERDEGAFDPEPARRTPEETPHG